MRSPAALIVLVASATLASAAPLPREAGGLEFRLEAPATVFKGEPFTVRVFAVNGDREPVTFVRPTDGSLDGWRKANYAWHRGRTAECSDRPEGGGARCGNVNAWKSDDVVTLPAGGRVELRGWLGENHSTLNEPGAHFLRLRYDFDPDRKEKGLAGTHAADAIALMAELPKRVVSSESLAVTVLPAECPATLKAAHATFARSFAQLTAAHEAMSWERTRPAPHAQSDDAARRVAEAEAACTEAEKAYLAARQQALSQVPAAP